MEMIRAEFVSVLYKYLHRMTYLGVHPQISHTNGRNRMQPPPPKKKIKIYTENSTQPP
jgi:hypothetical protein